MKKFLAAALAGVMGVTMLASCGNDSGDSDKKRRK